MSRGSIDKLNLSAESWFRKPNFYNKSTVTNSYRKLMNDNEEKLKNSKAQLSDKEKELNTLEKKRFWHKWKLGKNNSFNTDRIDILTDEVKNLKDEIKFYQSKTKELQKAMKDQLKELKIADEQILDYKNFKYFLKNLKYIIEEINTNLSYEKKVNTKFLDDFKKYSNRKSLNPTEFAATDFKKKKRELQKYAEKQFKISGIKLCYPEAPLWRKFLAFFGKTNLEGVRESRSGKVYDLISDDEKLCRDKVENWMGLLIDATNKSENLTLSEITIPGSHDAGTYTMGPTTTTDIAGKIAQTQTGSIMAQLKSGIRRFDLRFRSVKGVLLVHHGIVNGGPVLEVIFHIVKFLKSHRREVIIIDIKASK